MRATPTGDGPSMPRHARAGFTLIEVIVAIAVVFILAATVTPSIIRQLDRARIDAAVDQFEALVEAGAAFQDDIGETGGPPSNRIEIPATLTQMTTAITTSDANICGQNYSGQDVSEWNGPYLNRMVPPTGLPGPLGTINNTITFVDNGNNDVLYFVIPNVTVEDILLLNQVVDDDGGSRTSGSIQWTPPDPDGLANLGYAVPVGGAC